MVKGLVVYSKDQDVITFAVCESDSEAPAGDRGHAGATESAQKLNRLAITMPRAKCVDYKPIT